MVKVSIKWNKLKFDNVELNLDDAVAVFKAQLYTLTNVPPERQKIMGLKGGVLKDDANLSTLGIKEGQQIMLMGTPDEKLPVPTTSEEKTVFVEDITPDEEAALTISYPGLTNLGNTCYLNATLQCLNAVPELKRNLARCDTSSSSTDSGMAVSLRELFSQLDSGGKAVTPFLFLSLFHQAFPQFAQKQAGGFFMQQDAEEAWAQLLTSLAGTLKDVPELTAAPAASTSTSTAAASSDAMAVDSNRPSLPSNMRNGIDVLFGGQYKVLFKNSEAPEEPETETTENFRKLEFHIDQTVRNLQFGLAEGLSGSVEKMSPSLGRSAVYTKKARISRLPPYLTIQYVRFAWKAREQTRAKILRDVKFPMVLDAYDLCTDELKAALSVKREEIRKEVDIQLQNRYKNKDKDAGAVDNTSSSAFTSAVNGMTVLDNQTGWYELCAVLTHKGRTLDSGHYVAWIKRENDQWYKFDDDKVDNVSEEEVKKLSGGGDWHMVYLLLYRSRRPDNTIVGPPS